MKKNEIKREIIIVTLLVSVLLITMEAVATEWYTVRCGFATIAFPIYSTEDSRDIFYMSTREICKCQRSRWRGPMCNPKKHKKLVIDEMYRKNNLIADKLIHPTYKGEVVK